MLACTLKYFVLITDTCVHFNTSYNHRYHMFYIYLQKITDSWFHCSTYSSFLIFIFQILSGDLSPTQLLQLSGAAARTSTPLPPSPLTPNEPRGWQRDPGTVGPLRRRAEVVQPKSALSYGKTRTFQRYKWFMMAELVYFTGLNMIYGYLQIYRTISWGLYIYI